MASPAFQIAVVAFVLAPMAAGSLEAARPESDWSRVRHLKHGAEVIVTMQNGARPGPYSDVTRVVAATDAELIVAPLGPRAPIIRIPRAEVGSVTLRREKTRGSAEERARAALLGFLLTAVAA
ncbi:MAG TPA: hypothetical protein VGY57_12645, partial [Vicinamibacterales bacterium]|nr:hypothetical protein [Vicinamibacterales bacterium]